MTFPNWHKKQRVKVELSNRGNAHHRYIHSLLCGDVGRFHPHPQPYARENQGRRNPSLPHNWCKALIWRSGQCRVSSVCCGSDQRAWLSRLLLVYLSLLFCSLWGAVFVLRMEILGVLKGSTVGQVVSDCFFTLKFVWLWMYSWVKLNPTSIAIRLYPNSSGHMSRATS